MNIEDLIRKKGMAHIEELPTHAFIKYVREIEHVSIDKSSKEYEKYQVQTNQKIIKNIFNTYDAYVNKIYNIDINNNAMERVKNYFK